jgi:hypothetical protein
MVSLSGFPQNKGNAMCNSYAQREKSNEVRFDTPQEFHVDAFSAGLVGLWIAVRSNVNAEGGIAWTR